MALIRLNDIGDDRMHLELYTYIYIETNNNEETFITAEHN